MLRRPRNARTDRLTDWRFFFHIYLVCPRLSYGLDLSDLHNPLVLWLDDMAMRYVYVVPLHVTPRLQGLGCPSCLRQVVGWI